MTIRTGQRIILEHRPSGMPTTENFRVETVPLPSLAENQVLVETLYLSVDPYMRGRMNDVVSYIAPYPVGGVIEGGVVGRVVESTSALFQKGDIVFGGYGWQTHASVDAKTLRKIDPAVAPVTSALGVLGLTGLTAYFGLLDIGQPKSGETVVVSGAAGAVGTIVGQIANLQGAKSVGIAGSRPKCDYLVNELGFTSAVNYKDSDFAQQLERACPNGMDVYFDNVGGKVSDAVMNHMNRGARIVICGQIASYNLTEPDVGPRVQSKLLINSAMMKGFTLGDYASRFGEGFKALGPWVAEGKIKYEETIVDGFENTIAAFLQLFSGGNTGKLLVKVAD